MSEASSRIRRPFGVDDLTREHIAELQRIDANPRAQVTPIRRNMFYRLGLITAVEPKRPPRPECDGKMRRAPKPRGHALTKLARDVLAKRTTTP